MTKQTITPPPAKRDPGNVDPGFDVAGIITLARVRELVELLAIVTAVAVLATYDLRLVLLVVAAVAIAWANRS